MVVSLRSSTIREKENQCTALQTEVGEAWEAGDDRHRHDETLHDKMQRWNGKQWKQNENDAPGAHECGHETHLQAHDMQR